MLLRVATLADLNACLALNADSQTDHVWQMDKRGENETIAVRFQVVRLPRAMYVTYPRRRDDLLANWEGGSLILVASDKSAVDQAAEEREEAFGMTEIETPNVYAYCQFDAIAWQATGWISHMIVDRHYRRQGIGAAMLKAGILWGRKRGLRRLMGAVQTKNYPAIRFCEKFGFVFSGYNDRYFPNRDIALFFSLRI
jgi:GNAT superfamily N-acetyltransferase